MYRRSLQPRWREIAASILVIAVLLPPLGFLAGDSHVQRAPYGDELQGEEVKGIYLVLHGGKLIRLMRR